MEEFTRIRLMDTILKGASVYEFAGIESTYTPKYERIDVGYAVVKFKNEADLYSTIVKRVKTYIHNGGPRSALRARSCAVGYTYSSASSYDMVRECVVKVDSADDMFNKECAFELSKEYLGNNV